MDRQIIFDIGKTVINNQLIRVGNFTFTPAEGEQITHLLSVAGRMSTLKALPEKIKKNSFTVFFDSEGNHKVERGGASIFFNFENIDKVINEINSAVGISIDMQKLSPKTTVGINHSASSGDVFEGR